MKISVSILNLKEKNRIKEIELHRPDYIHIDVMDGIFVDNISCLYNDIKNYLNDYNYDVHLMVDDVKKYIDEFKLINPKYITFHVETNNVDDNINYLKKLGIKVGLAINPNTDIKLLLPYLDKIDLVLVMSVQAGYGGQEFIMDSIDRINTLYKYRIKNNLSYKISVDGGINDKTIKYVENADIVVSGSYVINNSDIDSALNVLRGV
ncbi:MAG: ribulose-phosphate 3-epimerase [Bacilli bacterium]|nr:ribulose-phosphate 3-epimerase [Bacilli bacterium]